MGVLTRSEMEQAIKAGGSVLYKGRVIYQLGDIPDEAELASGDPEQEAVARNALDAQIAALQVQRDRIAVDTSQRPQISPAPKAEEKKAEPTKVK